MITQLNISNNIWHDKYKRLKWETYSIKVRFPLKRCQHCEALPAHYWLRRYLENSAQKPNRPMFVQARPTFKLGPFYSFYQLGPLPNSPHFWITILYGRDYAWCLMKLFVSECVLFKDLRIMIYHEYQSLCFMCSISCNGIDVIAYNMKE